jgi:hypothetical protein
MSEGQSVTNLSCRIPWVIAGAGKLAPAANDPAPARTSRRLMVVLSPRNHSALRPALALLAAFLLVSILGFASSLSTSVDHLLGDGEQRRSASYHNV